MFTRFSLVVVAALVTAGCAAPENPPEECKPLTLEPERVTLTPRVDAILRAEASNCGLTTVTLATGPCGIDLLPRLTVGKNTYILADGGALQSRHFPCESATNSTTTLAPDHSARISARWNGTIDVTPCPAPCKATDFERAPKGKYTVTISAFNTTATATVEVR